MFVSYYDYITLREFEIRLRSIFKYGTVPYNLIVFKINLY